MITARRASTCRPMCIQRASGVVVIYNSDKANIHGSVMVRSTTAAACIGSQQPAKAGTLLYVDAI